MRGVVTRRPFDSGLRPALRANGGWRRPAHDAKGCDVPRKTPPVCAERSGRRPRSRSAGMPGCRHMLALRLRPSACAQGERRLRRPAHDANGCDARRKPHPVRAERSGCRPRSRSAGMRGVVTRRLFDSGLRSGRTAAGVACTRRERREALQFALGTIGTQSPPSGADIGATRPVGLAAGRRCLRYRRGAVKLRPFAGTGSLPAAPGPATDPTGWTSSTN